MRRISYSTEARRDIAGIWVFIANDNFDAAVLLMVAAKALLTAVDAIAAPYKLLRQLGPTALSHPSGSATPVAEFSLEVRDATR